jgi:hypothetical protein
MFFHSLLPYSIIGNKWQWPLTPVLLKLLTCVVEWYYLSTNYELYEKA